MKSMETIAVLGKTVSMAILLRERLEFDHAIILSEYDDEYKTKGLKNATIFTDIEYEKIETRWLSECSRQNWNLIFAKEIIENIKNS